MQSDCGLAGKFILGGIPSPSMSEKKSVSTVSVVCPVCSVYDIDDFLEPNVQYEISFILCANCEAMSVSEHLYEGSIE